MGSMFQHDQSVMLLDNIIIKKTLLRGALSVMVIFVENEINNPS